MHPVRKLSHVEQARLNAAGSHGIVTPEGRARAARNSLPSGGLQADPGAIRHGLCSGPFALLPSDDTEALAALHRSVAAHGHPRNLYERHRAGKIAAGTAATDSRSVADDTNEPDAAEPDMPDEAACTNEPEAAEPDMPDEAACTNEPEAAEPDMPDEAACTNEPDAAPDAPAPVGSSAAVDTNEPDAPGKYRSVASGRDSSPALQSFSHTTMTKQPEGVAPMTQAPVSWADAAALGERMTVTGRAFVDQLDAAQRAAALYPFAADTRRDWHYVPRTRPGLPLRAMTEAQRTAAWRLVDTALSLEGSAKARGVLALEALLRERERRAAYRDPENYALAFFGVPGPEPWGWRFEGHHLSLNLMLVPGIGIAVTPHFLGANPFSGRVVSEAGHGGLARVLERESTLAFQIVGGLDAAALGKAMIATRSPHDIVTGPGREQSLREPVGLPLDAMPAALQNRGIALVEAFLGHLHHDLAVPVMARIREAGLGSLRFAWAGATTPDRLHYYRLHGPTLIIEYDKTDLDHAHSVWHDPTNLFGEDHLRAHHHAAHGRH